MFDNKLTFLLGIALICLIAYAVTRIFPRINICIYDPPYLSAFMFLGYAAGMLYLPFSEPRNALFLSQVPLGDQKSIANVLAISSVYVFISVLFYFFGVVTAAKKFRIRSISKPSPASHRSNIILGSNFVLYLSCICFIIGFSYFLYYITVAGGIVSMLLSFSYFSHLAEELSLTTLPFNLMYLGLFLSLAHLVALRFLQKSLPWLSFSIFVVMLITCIFSFYVQARIYPMVGLIAVSLMSLTFPLNRPLRPPLSKRLIATLVILPILAAYVLLLRNENSLLINDFNSEVDGFSVSETFDYMTYQLIGRGNVVDLQQIAIIIHSWNYNNILLGATYFDWINNMLDLSDQPISVGIRTMQMYFPGRSGAPTPGILGELYVNFHLLSLVFIWLYGYLTTWYAIKCWPRGAAHSIVMHSICSSYFYVIIIKVDSTMLENLFVWIVPFATSTFFLRRFVPVKMHASLSYFHEASSNPQSTTS